MLDPVTLKNVLTPKVGEVRIKGGELLFSCPYHSDRTPSAFLNYLKEVFHCFSCGKSLSAAVFLQQQGFNPLQLIDTSDRPVKRVAIVDYEQINQKINKSAEMGIALFNDAMPISSNKKVLKYLERRICKDFVLPFSVKFHESRQSLIFKGQTIVERFLSKEATVRYKSYGPVNLVYSTKDTFPVKELIIVEGIFDMLKVYNAGYKNVAAILTTKITDRKLRQIDEITTDNILLSLDNDDAGKLATTNAVKKLHFIGKSVQILDLSITGEKDFGAVDLDQVVKVIEQTRKNYFDYRKFYISKYESKMFDY